MPVHPMPFPRSSGVLLHITSLPSPYGIGDLGAEAREFVDRLAAAGQTYWQVLPLGPTGFADSPYQCLSSFAGNTNLISLSALQQWLPRYALDDRPPFRRRRVEYEPVIAWRDEMLSLAFEHFLVEGGLIDAGYLAFCRANSSWLDDFALFMALKESHGQRPWVEWTLGEALRSPVEIAAAREKHSSRIAEHRFRQWLFDVQWRALHTYAHERGISLVGDVPIYVAHDSCDVWVNRNLFDLDVAGYPRVVAGVPPDYFSPTGQLWGNPLYLWSEHKGQGYAWWIERVRAALDRFDVVRIDHFRGFYDYWQIPGGAPTAQDGMWVDGPRDDVFNALRDALRERPGIELPSAIIAEDLGDKMLKVREWRDAWGLAGMKIVQFAFGDNEEERERFTPEKYTGANDDPAIIYVGTHDNSTALGWWYAEAADRHRERMTQLARLWQGDTGYAITEPNWDMIRMGMESRELVFIVSLQDVLGAGNSSRMNRPGVAGGNWRWRCTPEELEAAPWERLAMLTKASGRWSGARPS